VIRTLGVLTWTELKLFAREPLTVVFVLVLPVVMLYVLNGVFGDQADPSVWEGISAIDFYTPSYVALAVATVGVLSVPVQLASYREQGVLRRLRASAVPPGMVLVAHVMVAFVAAVLGAVLLVTVSALAYDATVPQDWLGVIAGLTLITVAFAALGALLGSVLPTARAAQGLGVLLFFVFMMLGGAGPPREVLPDAMATVADGVPLTHAGRLIRGPWLGGAWDGGAVLVMTGILVVSTALAAWRVRAQER
jgi:ABC-2 type transport system permease protein